MNTYFTSDPHYFHRNICRFAGRPYNSVEEMNEALIKNHNNVVARNDQVWFLGDFAFAHPDKIKGIIRRLKGKKFLILGNHDKEISRRRDNFIGEGLFTGIYEYKEININKQPIVLFHYGMRVWNRAHHGAWLLYGHSHGTLPPYKKSVDVGVDDKNITDEYRPYSFEEIELFMKKQPQGTHHDG